MRTLLGAVIGIGVIALLGCGGDETSAPAVGCPQGNEIGGSCAGVPSDNVCSETTCTTGVQCAKVVTVGTDAELQAATASAENGTCIALKAGSYGDATLPAGVSLLGVGAKLVNVTRVDVQGSGGVVQGVNVSGGGIRVDGSGGQPVRISQVRVTNSGADGVRVEAGAVVEIVRSDVSGSARYGVSGFGAGSISVHQSIVSGGKGPGVWAECADGCACAAPVNLDVFGTIIRDNKLVGVSIVGATATLKDVDITGNTVASGFQPGGGLSVSQCSNVTATGLRVLDNSHFGILVDDSAVSLGGPGSKDGVEVSRNLMGIWMQKIGTSFDVQAKLENCKILENSGVGLGLDGSSKGIIIYGTEVRETTAIALPVLVGGVSADSREVGDGLNWLKTTQAQIDGLTVSASARQSFLIDGEVAAGSSISNIALEQGDETKGILQQNLPSGGVEPSVGAGSPVLTKSPAEQFAVPKSPEVPMGIN
jgi:hypothetical protein